MYVRCVECVASGNELWASLAQLTAQLNGLEAMRVARRSVTSQGAEALDQLLEPLMPWVLKMHTDGDELELLRGALHLTMTECHIM